MNYRRNDCRGGDTGEQDRRRHAEREARREQRRSRRSRRAADRAEELARRAQQRAERLRRKAEDIEDSVDAWVDELTDRWSRKAEAFMDSASRHLDDLFDGGDEHGRSSRHHRSRDEEHDEGRASRRERRRRRRTARRQRRTARMGRGLYRDPDHGRIAGVCVGIADYLGIEAWQVRVATVLGFFFMGSVTVPAYIILWIVLDKKPYYRRVTDRFEPEESEDADMTDDDPAAPQHRRSPRRAARGELAGMSNIEGLRAARRKFAALEERVRAMESHVTSSQFELHREFRKIDDEA